MSKRRLWTNCAPSTTFRENDLQGLLAIYLQIISRRLWCQREGSAVRCQSKRSRDKNQPVGKRRRAAARDVIGR